jgi:hypothetical protein
VIGKVGTGLRGDTHSFAVPMLQKTQIADSDLSSATAVPAYSAAARPNPALSFL